MHKFTFINTLLGRINALRGTQNLHVQKSTLRLLRTVRLVLRLNIVLIKANLKVLDGFRFGHGNE